MQNYEPTDRYKQLQLKCGADKLFLNSLNRGYDSLSHGFLTREVRFVLEKCLTVEVLNSIAQLDLNDSQLAPLLLNPTWGIDAFVKNFSRQLKAHFVHEAEVLSNIDQDGVECEIRLHEIEDRYERLSDKFLNYYDSELDGGFKFLAMIKSVFEFESQMLSSTDSELLHRLSRKRRVSSALSTSSRGLSAEKFARVYKPLVKSENSELSRTLAYLKTVCITPERAMRQIDGVKLLTSEFLTLPHRLAVINNHLAYQDLAALEKDAPLELVYRTCLQFKEQGLLANLADPMKQLIQNSLVVTQQSDQVIRVGSGTASAGKYLKLSVRPMFAKVFEDVYGVKRETDLCVAVLPASAESAHALEQARVADLFKYEQVTNALLESKSINWESGTATLSLRFKARPSVSSTPSSGPKSTQAFILCVYYLTAPNASGLFPQQFAVYCLSKQIIFITNDNQRTEATAAIHWYAFDRPVYPMRSGSPQPLSIDKLVSLICTYIFEETQHAVNRDSADYFVTKCRQLSAKAETVSFADFCKKPLIGNPNSPEKRRSLWEFVVSCIKFIQDIKYGCKVMFDDGLLYGFVTRDRASEILQSRAKEGNSLALLRFSETMATITVAVRRSGETMHEVPKQKAHFESVSAPEFCYSSLNLSDKLIKDDGSSASAQDLRKYFPSNNIIPGYVALSRDLDFMSIGSFEPSDIDADEFNLDGLLE